MEPPHYRSHTDYCHGLDGFLVGTWMVENKWIHFPGVILQFLNHHYFKTFDELGVKAQNLLVL
jgi:hypothetical protein